MAVVPERIQLRSQQAGALAAVSAGNAAREPANASVDVDLQRHWWKTWILDHMGALGKPILLGMCQTVTLAMSVHRAQLPR
jgi:hypothetical protein